MVLVIPTGAIRNAPPQQPTKIDHVGSGQAIDAKMELEVQNPTTQFVQIKDNYQEVPDPISTVPQHFFPRMIFVPQQPLPRDDKVEKMSITNEVLDTAFCQIKLVILERSIVFRTCTSAIFSPSSSSAFKLTS